MLDIKAGPRSPPGPDQINIHFAIRFGYSNVVAEKFIFVIPGHNIISNKYHPGTCMHTWMSTNPVCHACLEPPGRGSPHSFGLQFDQRFAFLFQYCQRLRNAIIQPWEHMHAFSNYKGYNDMQGHYQSSVLRSTFDLFCMWLELFLCKTVLYITCMPFTFRKLLNFPWP